jgi:hypothetical protein
MSRQALPLGHGPVLVAALTTLVLGARTPAAEPAVKHPNLLLNRDEIEQVKAKIKDHAWAAGLLDRVRELADDQRHSGRNPREAALVYALTGEDRYGQRARRTLLGGARVELDRYEKLDIAKDPDFGAWGPWATYAWAYDLTYDLYSDEERRLIERLLRTAARAIIEGLKHYVTTPNLVFEKHWKVALVGYCLGDRELIEWGLNDPGLPGPSHGGFYQVLDTMIRDGHFWGEAPIYALHYDLHGMLAVAEAALHYDGTDLYNHVSEKSGASIKDLIDGYLLLAYPLEKTGVEGGSIRMATFGDGSTAYSPRGELTDTFLINPVGATRGEVTLNGELEVAYKRYRDPGYAWLLSRNPRRDAYIGSPGQGGIRPIWGYAALTHGQPLPADPAPPPAPGGLHSSQGFAMLRADETPDYWTTGSTAAVLRLGAAVGHGHKDYFHLILHGKGRLLYPDLNVIQYEPTALNWTHEGIAHNTLLVDHASPRPGPFSTRRDFTPDAKFFAVSGSAFEGVQQTRALLMTKEYVADVFRAAATDGRERTFDWVLHGLGRLYPGNPGAYRPTHALVPFYWWIDNERGRTTADTWQADWVQQGAGVSEGTQRFGKEWFEQTVGVRATMLGVSGTEVYHGDGPITDGPPYHRLDGNPEGSSPMVVARRRAVATTFCSVHEPYARRAALRRMAGIQETDEAAGVVLEGEGFSDRVLVAFGADADQVLHDDGEAFVFRDYGYVRRAGDRLTVRGQVKAFRVRAPKGDTIVATLNGKPMGLRQQGEFLIFGAPPAPRPPAVPAARPGHPEDVVEQRATVHYSFLPEEVHLRAGSERDVALHLRCVGRGTAQGKLRLVAPRGIAIEPVSVDLGRMSDGEEEIVPLRVKAATDTASGLRTVGVEPGGETLAAAGSLPVSVGTVITEDKRVPLLAQFVIRAPGYTMRLDQMSGVSYYLLDADGHRRHGRIHNTNYCYGLPALVTGDDHWVFRYRQPCQFVWEGEKTLTAGPGGGERARLRYTFDEDRIVIALIPHPPSDPKKDYVLWLGNFDALGQPRALGSHKLARGSPAADWYFYPHPIHRQGVLLGVPEKTELGKGGGSTAVSLPLRVGQEVVLRFATEEELKSLFTHKDR